MLGLEARIFQKDMENGLRYLVGEGLSSVTQSCPTLCNPMDAARQASLSITNSQSLLKLLAIKSVMPSNHLILCRPLLGVSCSVGVEQRGLHKKGTRNSQFHRSHRVGEGPGGFKRENKNRDEAGSSGGQHGWGR